MRITPYDRAKAVAYAHKWAYGRNPAYYDFEKIGGDCTNFASQCILNGGSVMNFKPELGWYYISAGRRSASWTGVEFLYSFLVNNKGVGPFAEEVSLGAIQPGDVIQLKFKGKIFQHSPVVVEVGTPANVDNILVAAHTLDCDYTPLSSYNFSEIRFIHILGVRH